MTNFHAQVISIDGMHCDACVRRATQALGAIRGVRVHSVEVGQAKVMAEPSCAPEIREAIAAAGFTVTELHEEG